MSVQSPLSTYKADRQPVFLTVDVSALKNYKRHTKVTIGDKLRGIPNSSEDADSKSANQIVRDQFARRLYAALIQKGWTQSELARRAGIARDRVSKYINAEVLPTSVNLEAIAKALGVQSSDLMQSLVEALALPAPQIDRMSYRETAPGLARLQVNRVVKLTTAIKVSQLIAEDGTDDTKSSD